MSTPTIKLYPSAPLGSDKNDVVEQRIKKKLNDVNSFVKSYNRNK